MRQSHSWIYYLLTCRDFFQTRTFFIHTTNSQNQLTIYKLYMDWTVQHWQQVIYYQAKSTEIYFTMFPKCTPDITSLWLTKCRKVYIYQAANDVNSKGDNFWHEKYWIIMFCTIYSLWNKSSISTAHVAASNLMIHTKYPNTDLHNCTSDHTWHI